MRQLAVSLCIIGNILMITSGVDAHPFAVTSTEAEYNRESQSFEVAMRVYPEQLEQALSKETGRTISLEHSTNIDPLIIRYLTTHFSIQSGAKGGKSKEEKTITTLRWIGKEVTPKNVWLYFEVPIEGSLQGLVVKNSMFFQFSPEQLHSISITTKDRVASCTLSKNEPQSLVHWKSREKMKSSAIDKSLAF